MTAQIYNNTSDTLANSIDNVVTSFELSSGNIPSVSAGDYIPIYVVRASDQAFETMHVTAVSGTTITVDRAAESPGNSPLAFSSGDSVQIRQTRQSLLEMEASSMTAATATGQSETVADALGGRVVSTESIASMQGLDTSSIPDGKKFSVLSWHPPTFPSADLHGGGNFYWDSGSPKSLHNGISVISPTVPTVTNQAGATEEDRVQNFIDGTGETDGGGNGVFVREIEGGRVKATDAGAKPGASFDSTYPIQKILDNFQVCDLENHQFKITSVTSQHCALWGNAAELVSSATTFAVYYNVGYTPENPNIDISRKLIDGVHITSDAAQTGDDVAFNAGAVGLKIRGNNNVFGYVDISKFEKGVDMTEDDTYIIDFDWLRVRFCDIGINADFSAANNSGERISVKGGVIADNNYNANTNLCNLWLDHVSVDYPKKAHWKDNVTDVGGVASSAVKLKNCHIETTVDRTPDTEVRFGNSGAMSIEDCVIWDGTFGATDTSGIQLFGPSGRVYVSNTPLRFSSESYIADPSSNVAWRDSQKAMFNQYQRVSRKASGFINNGLENGNTSGWSSNFPGNIAHDSVSGADGSTNSVRVDSRQFEAVDLFTSKSPIPHGSLESLVSVWFKKETGSLSLTFTVDFYDADDNLIESNTYRSSASLTAGFEFDSSLNSVPSGAAYLQMKFSIPLHDGVGQESFNVDEAYVTYF